jgi:diaminohydroxyphosphoribosylaminopyrimidine deaminase/5-amino-6-(5-phosphoribosylamino)uracil reductase
MHDAGDERCMRRAIELARQGEGRVEPNPMVGAVIASPGGTVVGEGFHERFGGPHAEVVALAVAGEAARGGTLYVTLEPCCHHGKTPPCTQAILAAGITRVVVAAGDPFPAVAGGGIATLRAAGVVVETGVCETEAVRLTAPFRMLVTQGRPWVIAKWAATLDGFLAAPPGDDRWISSPESRAIVHELRGRVDAILVGIGTALADDPMLSARPEGPRRALRVVLDSSARLPLTSQLVGTARHWPLLVATGPSADPTRIGDLVAAGAEVWRSDAADPCERLVGLLAELGRRRHTNVLVEGGAGVLDTFFRAGLVDEIWAFTAAKVFGQPARDTSDTCGSQAPTARLPEAPPMDVEEVSHPGGDLFVRGLVRRTPGIGTSTEKQNPDERRWPASERPAKPAP